jgi:hypothetical protein
MKQAIKITAAIVVAVAYASVLEFVAIWLGGAGDGIRFPIQLTDGPISLLFLPMESMSPQDQTTLFCCTLFAAPIVYAVYAIILVLPTTRTTRLRRLIAVASIHFIPALTMIAIDYHRWGMEGFDRTMEHVPGIFVGFVVVFIGIWGSTAAAVLRTGSKDEDEADNSKTALNRLPHFSPSSDSPRQS